MRRPRLFALVMMLIPGTAEAEASSSCPDHDVNRNVYFGDLHVHSSLSLDAYVFGTRVTPEQEGWVADDGHFHQAIREIAGVANSEADVDLATCAPRGAGASRLSGVWRDPDFDPARGAVYYARVLENPSCRYTTRSCATAASDERPHAATIRESPHDPGARLDIAHPVRP